MSKRPASPPPVPPGELPRITAQEAEAGRFFDARPAVVQAALACKDLRLLLWGPAGTGKTRTALEKIRAIAVKYPGARLLMLRSVRKWLTQAALVTWEKRVLVPGDLMTDKIRPENRSEYRFPNGSVVAVSGLDDPQSVMSSEWDAIYLQEATEVAEEVAEVTVNRLRWGRVPYQQLIMDCNPTFPQHWIKRLIDADRLTHFFYTHKDNPYLWDYDRQQWTKAGDHYVNVVLESMTGTRRARLRDGRWVQAEGVVYDQWSTELHVVAPFKIPQDWRRLMAIDFGFTHPLVIQWWAVDPDGQLVLYREIFRTEMLVQDAAAWALRLNQQHKDPRPEVVICDHDREDRATFERHARWATTAARKEILPGIEDVKARLKVGKNGRPGLVIQRGARVHEPDANLVERGAPTCTADEMDAYIWDPRAKKGEQPLDLHNHGLDALRYLVRWLDHGPSVPLTRETVSVGEPLRIARDPALSPDSDYSGDSYFERFPG